jgi:hypothetical protein
LTTCLGTGDVSKIIGSESRSLVSSRKPPLIDAVIPAADHARQSVLVKGE